MRKKDPGVKPFPGKTLTAPVSRHQRLIVTIASLGAGGEGVARHNNLPIFVSRVAPGDVVEIELFDVRKDFARGKVLRIVQPSLQRAQPPCKLFKVCGGCQWQHIAYENQLAAKNDLLRQALKHIGGLDSDKLQGTIGNSQPLFYRNKVQFPVARSGDGRGFLAGYYKEGSHELVNIKHCPVQPEPFDRLLSAVKEALSANSLSAYDESTHQGLVRHINARFSFACQQILLTLVVNSRPDMPVREIEALEAAAAEVMRLVPEVVGVCLNFNWQRGNRIMGQTTRCLVGAAHIVEILKSKFPDAPLHLRQGISFQLSANSFFQVNSGAAVILLDEVLSAVSGTLTARGCGVLSQHGKIPLLVDAYAGVGTMALWLSGIVERIIAVEAEPAAVCDGKVNMELNGIANIEFRHGKVENVIPQLLAEELLVDVLILDPPRKGVESAALASVVQLGARRIIYVSCNPATLARDLKFLVDKGYQVMKVQPVDMFPQTHHVESVTILDRLS